MDIDMLSERLKTLRGNKTQNQIATEIREQTSSSITQQTLGRYENANTSKGRLPKIELLCDIADYYNVSVDYLLGRTKDKTVKPEMQWAIEYIGISEESINKLHKITHFNPNGSTDLDTEFADTLNSFIQSEWFSELIVNLMTLKLQSDDYNNYQPTTLQEWGIKKEIEKECKLSRFDVSELMVHICDKFDRRNNDG